ncbi:MAG: type II toxin-antitoxin system RelE/ParE family toxin, partial [Lachnospiraceae bacterium]|nr:type II toxin-antitoxin system RelE/ParE family toxin [Lachnospiraceae bacterium]
MYTIDKTDIFSKWLRRLKDRRAKAIIINHIDNMEDGKMGVFESVGRGIFEKKIDYGPGYRLYCAKHDESIILLLCGGDKSTQQEDIKQAKKMWKVLKSMNIINTV